jgi:CRP-like cAMP-binding protein
MITFRATPVRLSSGESPLRGMPLHIQDRLPNRLLVALPPEDRYRLTSNGGRVRLHSGTVLFEAGERVRHAFFPLSGMASIISITPEGKSVGVAAIGSEGMVGLPAILGEGKSPYQAMTQLPLEAVRVGARSLRSEFDRGGRFKELLLGHAFTLLTQVTQSASCHRFHTVEQRLARWLLTTRDRAASDRFRLTQEFLSFMLGVPRTSVTLLAATMQAKGLIAYSRGAIIILDARELEAASCDCYRVIRREIERQLAA